MSSPEIGRHSPRRVDPREDFAPLYVVWELTLKCDLACRHCGSRAGKAREAELSMAEARDVVAQLAGLGTRELAFIGGEAYLYPEWLQIVSAARDAGIRPTMTSGARALDAEMCQRAADAGLEAISVSVDGLRSTHDTLRAVKGSFDACIEALGHIRAAGMQPFANTQINRLNLDELPELTQVLEAAGILCWQVQLTGPMGRAADRPEWLLQPYEMLEAFEVVGPLARAMTERGIVVNAGNNLGYYGPYEKWIRREPYGGCAAGRHVLGIEANGDIKGCPSLPSGPYVGANLRDHDLATIWRENSRVAFARDRGTRELWGRCKGCYYAEICKGGCSWTAHAALGKRGNMPWCHHRAIEAKKEGRRERLELTQAAPGDPFDFAQFRLIEEDWPADS